MKCSKQILLVESNVDSRELVSWYLIRSGYLLMAATSYAESLTLANAGRFDLHLLGEGFQDGRNLDLCRQIRTFDPDTPILFCSAWAYPADIDRGMKAGAQAYLTKPCDLERLAQTIEQLTSKAATQADIKSGRLQWRGALSPRRVARRFESLSLSA